MAGGERRDFVALLDKGSRSFRRDGMVRPEAKGVVQECIRTLPRHGAAQDAMLRGVR